MTRKVNKPRVTLRKQMLAPRQLNPIYRGVVPMLLRFKADFSELEEYSPETILSMIGMYMQGKYAYQVLTKPQLKKLRGYLKKHNIADWTVEEIDDQRSSGRTARTSRGRKNTSSGRVG